MTSHRMRPLLLVVVLAIAFGLGFIVRGGGGNQESDRSNSAESNQPERWTCSMHPQIILPSNDQQCPICFMDLIPLEEDDTSGLQANELTLSPEAVALAEVNTSLVQRRFVSRRVPLVGKVSADETTQRKITARFGGRLDRLHIASTGQKVHGGMKLAEIYSPEIYGAQAELQTAVASLKAAGSGADAESARRLVSSARKRLELLGLERDQINKISEGGVPRENLMVYAPSSGVVVERHVTEGQYVQTGSVLFSIADLSSVWVSLQAYERDLKWLSAGQETVLRLRSNPGPEIFGIVQFVDPILDEKTRTVEVRVEVENPQGLLKPGMLVSAEIESVLDAAGEPINPDQVGTPPLVIPASAPLLTGRRAVVYVRLPQKGKPVFQGRQVTLGPRAGDFFLVEDGLQEGEEVVTRGGFKIDSALQILARPSMMMEPSNSDLPAENNEKTPTLEVPKEFQNGLATLLETYLNLQKTLAEDDEAGSATAVEALNEALSLTQSQSSELPVAAVIQWTEYSSHLEKVVSVMLESPDLATRRVSFQPLSDNLWNLFESFGSPVSLVVRRFNCPMAFDNKGADWIQLDPKISNPYFGEMMLRCGTQVATMGPEGQ